MTNGYAYSDEFYHWPLLPWEKNWIAWCTAWKSPPPLPPPPPSAVCWLIQQWRVPAAATKQRLLPPAPLLPVAPLPQRRHLVWKPDLWSRGLSGRSCAWLRPFVITETKIGWRCRDPCGRFWILIDQRRGLRRKTPRCSTPRCLKVSRLLWALMEQWRRRIYALTDQPVGGQR